MQPTADRDSSKLFLEVLQLKAASQEIVKHLEDRDSYLSDPAATKKALRLACSAGRDAVDSAIFRVTPRYRNEDHPSAAILPTASWDVRHFTLHTAFWPRDVLSPFLHHQKRLGTLVLHGFMHAEFVDALMTTHLTDLTNLELHGVSWDSTPSKPLAALPFFPQLRRLKIKRLSWHIQIKVPLPDNVCADAIRGLQLPHFLPSCSLLEVLDYRGDDDVFSDILRISLPRLREFHYATFLTNYIKEEYLLQKLSGLSVASTWPSLKKLSLRNRSTRDPWHENPGTILAYMNCFAAVDGINEFSIEDGKFCANDMPSVLNVPWCSNLTSLKITGNVLGCLIDDNAASCFAQVNWDNLQRLEFDSFYEEYYSAFVRGSGFSNVHMPSLTHFSLLGIKVFTKAKTQTFSIPVCNQLKCLKLHFPYTESWGDFAQVEKAWYSNLLRTRNLQNLEHLEIYPKLGVEAAVEMANVGYGTMPALKSLQADLLDEREIIDDFCRFGQFLFFLDALKGSAPRQVVTVEDFRNAYYWI